jgi:hypothetical protein
LINFAVCIFLSAFLLFQIQPIISKTLLPWFGGTPAVWSSAMLFFEIALTGGYAYSNWLVRSGHSKKQTAIHLALMGISAGLVIFLWVAWPSPITPPLTWRPVNVTNPIMSIFFLLTISVGLPFFVLATNSPLMQAWFSRKNPGRSPYWLYALSNTGSILGLLAYPVVIEPMLSLQWQGRSWAGVYILFVALAAYNAILTLQGGQETVSSEAEAAPGVPEKADRWRQFLWVLLSACASLLVLAVTSQITQEVAVIPFLWVLPLTIYLLSFVLAFSSRRWYQRGPYTLLLLLGTGGWFYLLLNPTTNFIVQIAIYNFLLFAAAMICHGELFALRPQAASLTHFYLMVSIGGALGGFFVNLIAPLIFRGYWELYLGIAFAWILLAILTYRRADTRRGFLFGVGVAAMAMVVSIFAIYLISNSTSGSAFIYRNFYGVVRVKQIELGKDRLKAYVMVNGSTNHGFQFMETGLRDTPTSYYSRDSGVGLAILSNPHYGSGMRVGVLGLGTGTLAAYGKPRDHYRFYEINPVVIELANGQNGYFSFVKDSPAGVDIVSGDARLSLENELKAGSRNNFDILVLDTFSSDSIPVHLVTLQAFELYLKNLTPDGLIAANISNRALDLRPVLWQVAQSYGLKMAIVDNPAGKDDPAANPSAWVLLTRNPSLFEAPALAGRIAQPGGFRTDLRPWTDDYSNLIQIIAK